jgi:hypothetical protein
MKNQRNKIHGGFVSQIIRLALIFGSLQIFAAHAPAIEGIYVGKMKVNLNHKTRVLPLQLALSTTGETVVTQFGPQLFEERIVIDGAFLVDDEGGPYGVGHVTYNVDLSQLDLRYNRRDITLGQVPASFRLNGNVDANGNVLGRVISGFNGVIGSFELKRAPQQTTLKVTHKYKGVWAGYGVGQGGTRMALEIGLGTSLRPQVNPPNYEFYYTPGKLGYVSWNGIKTPFAQIAVDYLRRRVIFSDSAALDNGPVETAECEIDEATGDLVGTLYGVYRGVIATFRLKKKF